MGLSKLIRQLLPFVGHILYAYGSGRQRTEVKGLRRAFWEAVDVCERFACICQVGRQFQVGISFYEMRLGFGRGK